MIWQSCGKTFKDYDDFIKKGDEDMKVIEGFEDYAVDINGNIYSKKSKEWKIRKAWKSHGGYLYIELCKNGIKYRKAVHRLVARNFCEGWFEGAVVNHRDSNKTNNCADNLEWITQKENIHESYKNSTYGATRNYNKFNIEFKGEIISPVLIGQEDVKRFAQQNCLPLSLSSLIKYRKSNGYVLNVL